MTIPCKQRRIKGQIFYLRFTYKNIPIYGRRVFKNTDDGKLKEEFIYVVDDGVVRFYSAKECKKYIELLLSDGASDAR